MRSLDPLEGGARADLGCCGSSPCTPDHQLCPSRKRVSCRGETSQGPPSREWHKAITKKPAGERLGSLSVHEEAGGDSGQVLCAIAQRSNGSQVHGQATEGVPGRALGGPCWCRLGVLQDT